jgi:hypothetical protein
MVQTERPPTPRRAVHRILAAAGIVLASLAVAAPSWAGPMMGC